MKRAKKLFLFYSFASLCLIGLAFILLIRVLDLEYSPLYRISYDLIGNRFFPGETFSLDAATLSRFYSAGLAASDYLHSYSSQRMLPRQHVISNQTIGICITIVTQSRVKSADTQDLRVLSRAVARILQLQNETSASHSGHRHSAPTLDYTLHLCADTSFAEFDSVRQQSRAHLVSVHSSDEPPSDSHYNSDARRKEQLDYAFCLRQALRKCPPHTRYVLALEDDALLRPEFDPLLRHLVFERLPRAHRSDVEDTRRQTAATLESIGYVKLYHPMRLSGYFNPEPSNVAELLALSLLLALVLFFLSSCTSACRRVVPRTRLLGSLIVGVVLVVVMSRQALVPLRRAHPSLYQLVSAPSCCFPAVLFPVHAVEHALVLLANARSEPKDLLFDQFVERTISAADAPLVRLDLSLEQLRQHREATRAFGGRAGAHSDTDDSGARVRVRLRNYLFWPTLVDHIGLYSGRLHGYELPWTMQ